ncbi:hypothetical protein [Alicyclobacillus fastidiosus]|uniref:ROK family protein n=1 Tax=Alicyclobacillus fastidiosus TaxID=392011 RepID=UPI003D67BCB1
MNKTAILQLLREKAPLTKAVIASEAELTFATVSNLIEEMQADDLIIGMGYAQSQGGRKPVLYRLNPDAFYFIGIDLQVEKIVCVLTDFEGTLVHSDSIPYHVEDGPYKAVQSIRTLIDQVLSDTKTTFWKIRGMGVSVPGPIDNQAGIIISPRICPVGVTFRFAIC